REQRLKSVERTVLLAGGDAHLAPRCARKLPIAVEVVTFQRFLEPERMIVGKRVHALDGLARSIWAAGVYEQIRSVADGAPRRLDQLHIAGQAASHRTPAELDRAEAALDIFLANFRHLGRVFGE